MNCTIFHSGKRKASSRIKKIGKRAAASFKGQHIACKQDFALIQDTWSVLKNGIISHRTAY